MITTSAVSVINEVVSFSLADGGHDSIAAMTQIIADRYRRWFDYERDSHAKTMASLDAVAPELRAAPSFQKAVDLMAHVVAARRMWLFRFGVSGEKLDLFPQSARLADVQTELALMEGAWTKYLNGLDDAELQRIFVYQSYDGSRFRNSVEDIFTQLFGHSWYHRGQIAQLLRMMGAEPAVTDFVFWAREPVDEITA
jgi:uncharacterized damage-inducible protein DinB